MKLHVPRIFRVLGSCALVGLAACAATPDSLLVGGEHVTTGKKRFDAFFDQVAELRDKVDGFETGAVEARHEFLHHGSCHTCRPQTLVGVTQSNIDQAYRFQVGASPLVLPDHSVSIHRV